MIFQVYPLAIISGPMRYRQEPRHKNFSISGYDKVTMLVFDLS